VLDQWSIDQHMDAMFYTLMVSSLCKITNSIEPNIRSLLDSIFEATILSHCDHAYAIIVLLQQPPNQRVNH
jgi:hypothetical protein